MTIDRAIEILDPTHREHYESVEIVNEACRMGMEALKKMKEDEWQPFIFRELTEEEKKEHQEWDDVIDNLPETGVDILVSDGKFVWADELVEDGKYGDVSLKDNVGIFPNMMWKYFPDPHSEVKK